MKSLMSDNAKENVAAQTLFGVCLCCAIFVCGCTKSSGTIASTDGATEKNAGESRSAGPDTIKPAASATADAPVKSNAAVPGRVDNGGIPLVAASHEPDPPPVVVPPVFGAGPKSNRVPQLSQLDRLIGTWTGSVTDQSGNTHPITISRRWVMGGYYVLSELQFHDGTTTIHALDVTTFDPRVSAYRRWYFDRNGYKNSLAYPVQLYGIWEDGTLRLDAIDPDTGNQVNYVQKVTADDRDDWTLNYVNENGETVEVYHGVDVRISRDPLAAFQQRPQSDASPVIGTPNGPTGEIPELRMLNRMVGLWNGDFDDVSSGKKAEARYATNWTMNGTILLTQFSLYDFPKNAPSSEQIDFQALQLTTFDPQAKTFRQWHFDTDANEDTQVRYWILTGTWSDGPPTIRFAGFAFDSRFQMFWTHKYPSEGREYWELGYIGANMHGDMKYTLAHTCTLTRENHP